jgi:hypothetical protein
LLSVWQMQDGNLVLELTILSYLYSGAR